MNKIEVFDLSTIDSTTSVQELCRMIDSNNEVIKKVRAQALFFELSCLDFGVPVNVALNRLKEKGDNVLDFMNMLNEK